MQDAMPRVEIREFVRKMDTGANKPELCICEGQSKREDYVVKFHGKLNNKIIHEYASAYLANCLSINTPPAAFVIMPHELANNIRDSSLRGILDSGSNIHWGSRFVKDCSELTIDTYISNDMIEKMVFLFAFDMLIQNFDRTLNGIGKPNLLVRGSKFFAIDHDKTFSCTDPFARFLSDNPSPWELRGSIEETSHIFKSRISKYAENNELSFEPFISEIDLLPDETIDNMFRGMPSEWRDRDYENLILSHLRNIRNNLQEFSDGLLEVFA